MRHHSKNNNIVIQGTKAKGNVSAWKSLTLLFSQKKKALTSQRAPNALYLTSFLSSVVCFASALKQLWLQLQRTCTSWEKPERCNCFRLLLQMQRRLGGVLWWQIYVWCKHRQESSEQFCRITWPETTREFLPNNKPPLCTLYSNPPQMVTLISCPEGFTAWNASMHLWTCWFLFITIWKHKPPSRKTVRTQWIESFAFMPPSSSLSSLLYCVYMELYLLGNKNAVLQKPALIWYQHQLQWCWTHTQHRYTLTTLKQNRYYKSDLQHFQKE